MLAYRHRSRQYAGERHSHPCPGCYSGWCPSIAMIERAEFGSVSIRKGGWGLCHHCSGDLPAAVVVIGAVRDFRPCQSSLLLSMG